MPKKVTWVIALDPGGDLVVWWKGRPFRSWELVEACNFDLPYEAWKAFRTCLDRLRSAASPGSRTEAGCRADRDRHPPCLIKGGAPCG